jgi:hypothetical protein|tara:strand:+ start:92 stop:370 length:279 start_codon:yes stop_codon:yes gene_type:complete
MTEANIFISHKDARDYFYYRTEFTIKDVLVNVPDKSNELEMIRMDLTMYTDELLTQLESFEEYEMCKKVKEAMTHYYHQVFKLQMDLEKLDK